MTYICKINNSKAIVLSTKPFLMFKSRVAKLFNNLSKVFEEYLLFFSWAFLTRNGCIFKILAISFSLYPSLYNSLVWYIILIWLANVIIIAIGSSFCCNYL